MLKLEMCRLHPIALDGFAVETLTLYFSTSPGDAATAATPIEGSGHVERAPVGVPFCRKMIEAISYSACGVGSRVVMAIHDSVLVLLRDFPPEKQQELSTILWRFFSAFFYLHSPQAETNKSYFRMYFFLSFSFKGYHCTWLYHYLTTKKRTQTYSHMASASPPHPIHCPWHPRWKWSWWKWIDTSHDVGVRQTALWDDLWSNQIHWTIETMPSWFQVLVHKNKGDGWLLGNIYIYRMTVWIHVDSII